MLPISTINVCFSLPKYWKLRGTRNNKKLISDTRGDSSGFQRGENEISTVGGNRLLEKLMEFGGQTVAKIKKLMQSAFCRYQSEHRPS